MEGIGEPSVFPWRKGGIREDLFLRHSGRALPPLGFLTSFTNQKEGLSARQESHKHSVPHAHVSNISSELDRKQLYLKKPQYSQAIRL